MKYTLLPLLAFTPLLYAAPTVTYNKSHTKILEVEQGKDVIKIDQPLFSVTLGNGMTLDSTDFKVSRSSKSGGNVLTHAKSGLTCHWKSIVKPNTDYVRHVFKLHASKRVRIQSFLPSLLPSETFSPTGNVLGSPLESKQWFAAMEYPMSFTEIYTKSLRSWSPNQLKKGGWTTLNIPTSKLKGKFQLKFQYSRGSQKLNIRRVAILVRGKVMSEDKHNGFTGGNHDKNIYQLDASKVRGKFKLIAEVRGDQNNDSYGNISFLGQDTPSRYQQGIRLDRDLKANESITYSSVIGYRSDFSMRRSFLAYLENERARPYKMFLHYNSWYDICHSTPRYNLTSENCSRVINQWQKKLTDKYGVQLDSYVFDDGWDDYKNLWHFRKESFPNGFAPQAKLADKYGTHIGVWFSPFGGYGAAQAKRIKYARPKGYEVNGAGLSLAGKNYYKLFETQSLMMMKKYRVNYFKFDGLGGSNPAYLPDVEAAYRLMQNLRKENPKVYINLTTGTWASPFFLLHGDSTWRGGGDVHHRGTGSPTQKWLNYRDGEAYNNIVQRGKMFPLNSLMIHGVVYANRGEGKSHIDDSDEEFAMQAWSSFASGSQLQEFYISEDRMNDSKWKSLADAAKWGLKHEATLKDVHWIGGNPYKDEIYGWASLSPDKKKAIICIRNPSNQEKTHTFPLLSSIETDQSGWKMDKTVFQASDKITTSVSNDKLTIKLPAHKLTVIELIR